MKGEHEVRQDEERLSGRIRTTILFWRLPRADRVRSQGQSKFARVAD